MACHRLILSQYQDQCFKSAMISSRQTEHQKKEFNIIMQDIGSNSPYPIDCILAYETYKKWRVEIMRKLTHTQKPDWHSQLPSHSTTTI